MVADRAPEMDSSNVGGECAASSQTVSANEPTELVSDRAPEIAASNVGGESAASSQNLSVNGPIKVYANRTPEMASSNVGGECAASLSAVSDRAPSADCEGKQIQISTRAKCGRYLVRLDKVGPLDMHATVY